MSDANPILDRVWAAPTYRYKGGMLRGDVFHAMPWQPGDEENPLTEAPWGAPKSGDMLAHCPKGFWDVYIVPRDVFDRDFDPIPEYTGITG